MADRAGFEPAYMPESTGLCGGRSYYPVYSCKCHGPPQGPKDYFLGNKPVGGVYAAPYLAA